MAAAASKPLRVVILGGGYAGLTVAHRLAQQKRGWSITLIDAKSEFTERVRLHQVAAGQALAGFDYRSFLTPLGVEFIQAEVMALQPGLSALSLRRIDGSEAQLGYDYLVYALGSSAKIDVVPGVREHAHVFQSVGAAQQMYATLAQFQRPRVLVVGGGLTGIETAAELAECQPHAQITLAIDQPWGKAMVPGGFDRRIIAYLQQSFEKRHIALRSGARVLALRAGHAEFSDGSELAFDACIWTSGFAPPALARAAGIGVNAHGQILTDSGLRSISHPNIIAVGDAAQAASDAAGPCRMGSATALAMGTAAARTLKALAAGRTPPAFQFVYLFRNISLGRHDGVVQFVDRRDLPRRVVWTGANAAAWKEYICRSTLSTIGLTAAEPVPALPPVRMLPQLLRGLQQYA
ncbi:NAD(P)/FAD-dependent oxidoreductase [Paucibacter soli]|uniref:NAD(P)/FAD-dependent oxidoreductase n=1 Tax=Paucibacter soli TaxID=3133433 RepID=UPI0030B3EC9A